MVFVFEYKLQYPKFVLLKIASRPIQVKDLITPSLFQRSSS